MYFVTSCTQDRARGLTELPVAVALKETVIVSDNLKDTTTLAFTITPDHCHWLFVLGSRLSLGRLLARQKAYTKEALSKPAINWQRDFFEHRLRPDDELEAYAFYLFLNPYRAELIEPDAIWPYWWCPQPGLFAFTRLLNPNGSPPGEWIDRPVPVGLCSGE